MLCLGLQSSNIYYVASDRHAFAQLHSHSLWMTVAAAIAVGAIGAVYLALGVGVPIDPLLAVLALVGIPPAIYYLYVVNLLLGVGETDRFNRFELLARSTPLVFILALAMWPSPISFLAATVAASVLVSAVLFRAARSFGPPQVAVDKRRLLRCVRYGFKAYVVMMLGFLLVRIPVLFLGWMGQPEAVGQLSVALQLADMAGLLPATVAMLLFPRLVREEGQRERAVRQWLLRVALVMLPCCVLIAAFADPVIPFVFGDAFRGSVAVLQAMLPGVFVLALISVMSQYVAAAGLRWTIVVPWLLGVGVTAGIGWVSMPELGARGAGIAFSCGHAVVFLSIAVLCIRQVRRAKVSDM